MPDLTITRSGELYVSGVVANTDSGAEFVDAWTTADMVVIDSGRIIVPSDIIADLTREAAARGLSVSHEDGL